LEERTDKFTESTEDLYIPDIDDFNEPNIVMNNDPVQNHLIFKIHSSVLDSA
jgi:hypothetical protein